ncbi:demethylmenaquinone methyltransferase [Corynebacterium sphenisci]|uniref:demethylmenaquinone methyltransferase n=1 Tax=Corynebacterium sphenisci TaxID=191493 RepID=UPI0026DEC0DE|nr:demethylmenaquinone methyltransferase [Corynebacterium sphenisci]MDO5730855.1 demethylmenaquinone methyltransferase [Corynebacterium sphenisci]
MARADLDKKPAEVSSMFDAVGARYDLTNTIMTLGLDAYWRRRVTRRLDPLPGERVLDLAAGTAISTAALAAGGAWCVACDFSRGMLHAGAHRTVPKVCGDGMALPFADGVFDAVTITWGLRNIQDPEAGLRELARVTKPGGRLTVAEFSTPGNPLLARVYKDVVLAALPAVARAVASNPEAYVYLAESIRAWPDQEELARIITAAGWADCGWQNLTGGIAAMHSAVKPG